MKKILPLLLFVMCFVAAQARAAQLEEITQPALANLLNQNSGKVIFINFFATWCAPCKKEAPELVKLRSVFPPDKLEIIGLSVDEDRDVVAPFIKSAGIDYPVYFAADDVISSYGITSVPHNVFYSPNGELVISETGITDVDMLKTIVDELLETKAAAR